MNIFRLIKTLRVSTAWLVLICYGFVFYSPALLAAKQGSDRQAEYQQRLDQKMQLGSLSNTLQSLRDSLQQARREVVESRKEQSLLQALYERALSISKVDKHIAEIERFEKNIEKLNEEALHSFSQSEEHLTQRNLPNIIQERHQQAVEVYQSKLSALKNHLKDIKSETGRKREAALDDALEFIEEQKLTRSAKTFDPTQLPFNLPNVQVREPAQNLLQLSSAYNIPAAQQFATLSDEQLAALFANKNGPVEQDLAASPDVQLTDAIKAKAAELNHDPIAIYTWVHNSIRYTPSFGSIQGADYTLQALQGNAIDTASLLIALLRAADIPARYSHGTVRIPSDKVMNWVGGAQTPRAALELLGRGGVPSKGLTINGEIKLIELEHTWVEAWVDFEPSRGMKNQWGDSWVPMDASFKQYDFTAGMELETAVLFDAQALVDSIQSTAVVNEAEGWVQNVPQANIENALNNYQQQLEGYINNQNPDATVADVLGLQQVNIIPARPLSASLPYEKVVTKTKFSEVTTGLRHKFKINITADQYGTELVSKTFDTVTLAGKGLSISFNPATQADEDLIASYLPEPSADGNISPGQLPSSLPGYLIAMSLQLAVDDQVIATAPAGTMGSEVFAEYGLWDPDNGWFVSNNPIVVGEYTATALDLQGISGQQAQALKIKMEATQSILEGQDAEQLATLTKQQVVGDLLYATVMSYFALNDVQDRISAQAANILSYRGPSYGHFKTSLSLQYWFGIPRDVSFSGLLMDIDGMKAIVQSKRSDRTEEVNYMQALGSRASAMEHLVPEQMFSTQAAPAQGISSVKAIALAAAEGQKIYTITQSNLDSALAAITLDQQTENEIRAATYAGMTVTTHEALINYAGWTGAGYNLIDPVSGAGAYKISGGANGGTLSSNVVRKLKEKFIMTLLKNVLDISIPISYASSGSETVKRSSNILSVLQALRDNIGDPISQLIAAVLISVLTAIVVAVVIDTVLIAVLVGEVLLIARLIVILALSTFSTIAMLQES